MRGRGGRMAILAIVVTLLASACGGDDTTDADTDGSPPEADATITPGPDDDGATDDGDGVPPVDDTGDVAVADGADVCTLFENVDVAELLGEEPGASGDDGRRCVITPAAADSTAQVAVGLDLDGADAYAGRKEILGFDSEPEGLGDDAFITGTWIHVLSGDIYVDVQIVRNPLGEAPRLTDDDLVAAVRTVLTNVGMDS